MDQLQSALKAAHAGDVIKLAAGNYGDLVLSGLNLSGVKITSLDAGHPATFNTIQVKGSSGITFDHVSVKFTPDANTVAWTNAVYIYQSSGISFTNSTLAGGPAVNGVPITATTLDSTQNVIGLPTGRGIFVFNSSDVTIAGNDIQQFHKGVLMANATGITIASNDIHDLRTTPISGSNVKDVTIADNHLHDSTPWNFSGAGDHGDYIHLWTDPDYPVANDDIVIRNNFIEQGAGTALLGIYLDDNTNNIGFTHVEIAGNVVVNNNSQAVRLENVDGIVSQNVLLKASATTTQVNPSVYAMDDSHVTITDNTYTRYIADATSVVSESGNTLTNNALLTTTTDWTYDQIISGEATFQQAVATTTTAVSTTLATATTTTTTAPVATAVNITGTDGADNLGDHGVYSILTGKAGDDTYVVENARTEIVEAAGGGIDNVFATVNYTLSLNLENLTLRTGGLIGTGNDLDNQIKGNAADNVLDGRAGADILMGGDGNDTLYGGDGNDRLHGEAGSDILYGDAGDDWLAGYGGNDQLFGGAGADQLRGGPGADVLTGGAGADKFIFEKGDFVVGQSSTDRIADFSRADTDRIVLSDIDAKSATAEDDKFTFVGTKAFSGTAGELRYEFVGSDTVIYGDTNGDRIADLAITVSNNIALMASDFVL